MTNAEANELRETSKGAGAALAAAAPAAPKRKPGQKKEKTGFAAKKKPKAKAAATMDARRPLIQPVAEDPEEEEDEGGGELFCPRVGQPHTAPEGAKYESYYSRVCKMFYTFCERWTFIHQNDLELIDVDRR